jgi:hypothetical protein
MFRLEESPTSNDDVVMRKKRNLRHKKGHPSTTTHKQITPNSKVGF